MWELEGLKLYIGKGTTLKVLFNNGITKELDMKLFFDKYPFLKKLTNRKLFLRGKLFAGGIHWNDDVDIAIEAIDDYGKIVDKPQDFYEVMLGYKIKELRKEKNLSLNTLASLSGIDESNLSKIERGKFNPSIKLLKRIADSLNCDLEINLLKDKK